MKRLTQADMDKALLDPAAVFDTPSAVIAAEGVTREDQIAILRRWEYDARELQVAEEEGMQGERTEGDRGLLDEVLRALHALGVEPDLSGSSPTKQGGG